MSGSLSEKENYDGSTVVNESYYTSNDIKN